MASQGRAFYAALQSQIKRTSLEGAQKATQQHSIAVDINGWAIEDPFLDHPAGQRVVISKQSIVDIYDRLRHYTGGNRVPISNVLGRSLDLTNEELKTSVNADATKQWMIVGYASCFVTSSRTANPQCPNEGPLGLFVPSNVAKEDEVRDYLLVVTPIRFTAASQQARPQLYAVLRKKDGSSVAHPVKDSLVYFRHEFRTDAASLLDRSWSWSAKVTEYCSRLVGAPSPGKI